MKRIIYMLVAMLCIEGINAQNKGNSTSVNNIDPQAKTSEDCSMVILPIVKKAKPKKGEKPVIPSLNRMEALLCFEQNTSFYNDEALNVLDSLYSLAFTNNNDRFYKMTIIGYDDAEPLSEKTTNLARERAVLIFNYFLARENVKDFIIKRTPSHYYSSCEGDVSYFIKYKMPIDFKWVTLNGKPEAEHMLNGISFKGKVYILIEDDLEGCIGEFYSYFYPQTDTVLNGQFGSVRIPKGSLKNITNTKDTFDLNYSITYNEVFTFEDLMKDYKFIPSEKQYIVNAGYITINSDQKPDYNNCPLREYFNPSISIKVNVTAEQAAARMKFYAKVFKPDGSYTYKPLPTKKDKDKQSGEIYLTTEITSFQIDTVYLGKRVPENELSNYFYPAQQSEPGSFEAVGGWLKAYKLNKRGAFVFKKEMKAMLKKPVGEVEEG